MLVALEMPHILPRRFHQVAEHILYLGLEGFHFPTNIKYIVCQMKVLPSMYISLYIICLYAYNMENRLI